MQKNNPSVSVSTFWIALAVLIILLVSLSSCTTTKVALFKVNSGVTKYIVYPGPESKVVSDRVYYSTDCKEITIN